MSDSGKSIKEILEFSEEDYSEYVCNLLKEEGAILEVDEIDDGLLKIVGDRPADVERICRINSKVFLTVADEYARNLLIAYNFNTLTGALIYQNKITDAKRSFMDGIAFCGIHKQYQAGKSLSQNFFRLWRSTLIPLDEAPYFLTLITEFYKSLNRHEDAMEALRAAALHFADAAAYQSAYRAIHDAQEIAMTQKMLRSQIKNLETQGMVALIEGDLSCADAEFKKCFKLFKHIKEAPSFELKMNAATVKLRKNNYKGARPIYQALVDEHPLADFPDRNRQLKINLLVCCRELDDKSATESLSSEVEGFLRELDLEQRIEARLVLAKTYFHIGRLSQGTEHLKQMCGDMQKQIDQYHRLHYRRGIREHYLSRIKPMLLSTDATGAADNVLSTLVMCCSNALLDWFSVLKWVDSVMLSKTVTADLKERLTAKKEELIRFGTPFMYGFREKYDDPFEFGSGKFAEAVGKEAARAFDFSLPWHEFNDLASYICQEHGFHSPFEAASIHNVLESLKRRTTSGTAFLFSFACSGGCVFFFVIGAQYVRATISLDDLWGYKKVLFDYQNASDAVNRRLFKQALARLQICLEPVVIKILEVLEEHNLSELVFVPDFFTEGIPIFSSIIKNNQIRLRIKKTNCIFRTCPALNEEPHEQIITGPVLCVSNSDDNLELVVSEKALVKKAFAGQDYFEVDLAHEKIDFSSPPANAARIFHLATHSISADTFTDPFFVATATESKNAIWLESVQREAHNLQLKLVVLNGCNTGTTANRNYFKQFSTTEKVGLTSAFLLNRQCGVVATQWNETDIVSYTFSALFYKRLAIQPNAARSFALALMDLFELTKDDAAGLFKDIIDEPTRLARCNAVAESKTEFPFRDPFCLGMFQFHSLLAN